MMNIINFNFIMFKLYNTNKPAILKSRASQIAEVPLALTRADGVKVVHASELPVRHHPAAGRSRLPDGGPCSVAVIHASKLPVRLQPAAGRRLSDGGPCHGRSMPPPPPLTILPLLTSSDPTDAPTSPPRPL